MQKFCWTDFFGIKNLNNLRVMATVSLFVAISIISGKFLAISIGDSLRFSFENLTIILSGILFGPVVGGITGVVADLIGCILRGYAINPILTLGAALIGLISGILYGFLKECPKSLRIAVSTLFSHLIGSVIIKSFGLSLYYSLPFGVTLLSRCINYAVVFAAELTVLLVLMNNKGFINQINKIRGDN